MIVYTVGTFDLLHVGHLALLEYCNSLGDVLAVGVASDRVVNSYKPNVPVILCLLYTSPSPRDLSTSRMPSSA